jgi:hypothetical protein
MIDQFGKNLSVAILCKSNENWKQFAAWYSIKKYIPEAAAYIVLERQGGAIGIEWLKKLKIPYMTHNTFDQKDPVSNRLEICHWLNIKKPLLVMPSESFITREIDFLLEKTTQNLESNNVWLINDLNYETILENYRFKKEMPNLLNEPLLANDIRTNEISFITCYNKGVGNWINSETDCPFTNKKDLLDNEMTLNVSKGIELWTEMAEYYNQII